MEMFTEPSSWKWRCFIVESNWNTEQGCPLPDESSAIPVSFPEEGVLNLYSVKGILPQTGKKILLTGEFAAESDSSIFIGMAGEGRFLLHFNAQILLDGRHAGNNEFPLQHNSHILELDLKAGHNQLLYEVPASGSSARFFLKIMENRNTLAFRYGPFLTFPDSSDKGISIVFTGTRNSPAAVEYRKKGEELWTRGL